MSSELCVDIRKICGQGIPSSCQTILQCRVCGTCRDTLAALVCLRLRILPYIWCIPAACRLRWYSPFRSRYRRSCATDAVVTEAGWTLGGIDPCERSFEYRSEYELRGHLRCRRCRVEAASCYKSDTYLVRRWEFGKIAVDDAVDHNPSPNENELAGCVDSLRTRFESSNSPAQTGVQRAASN
jgi:hypothetical protein